MADLVIPIEGIPWEEHHRALEQVDAARAELQRVVQERDELRRGLNLKEELVASWREKCLEARSENEGNPARARLAEDRELQLSQRLAGVEQEACGFAFEAGRALVAFAALVTPVAQGEPVAPNLDSPRMRAFVAASAQAAPSAEERAALDEIAAFGRSLVATPAAKLGLTLAEADARMKALLVTFVRAAETDEWEGGGAVLDALDDARDLLDELEVEWRSKGDPDDLHCEKCGEEFTRKGQAEHVCKATPAAKPDAPGGVRGSWLPAPPPDAASLRTRTGRRPSRRRRPG